MSDIPKLSFTLTGEQVRVLQAAVDAGEYASTTEVAHEAIRDWQSKRRRREEEFGRLRAAWDAGIASGPAKPMHFEAHRKEARQRPKSSVGSRGTEGKAK